MLILVELPTKKFRSGDVYYSAPSYYDVAESGRRPSGAAS